MKKTLCPSMSSKRSFTLIEVLMVSIIIPLLMAVMFILMNAGNQIYGTVTTSMDIRQSARNAMERILREVRESNHSDVTTISLNADRISFTSPRFKDAGGVQIPIAYFLNSSGQIIREYPPNTFNPVAVDVTQLKFNDDMNPQLDITITTEKLINKRLLTYSIKQKVRLRNE